MGTRKIVLGFAAAALAAILTGPALVRAEDAAAPKAESAPAAPQTEQAAPAPAEPQAAPATEAPAPTPAPAAAPAQ